MTKLVFKFIITLANFLIYAFAVSYLIFCIYTAASSDITLNQAFLGTVCGIITYANGRK